MSKTVDKENQLTLGQDPRKSNLLYRFVGKHPLVFIVGCHAGYFFFWKFLGSKVADDLMERWVDWWVPEGGMPEHLGSESKK